MVGGEWLEVIATTAQVTITTGHHKHELVLIFFSSSFRFDSAGAMRWGLRVSVVLPNWICSGGVWKKKPEVKWY